MDQKLSESTIVSSLAEAACRRISRRTVSDLQKIDTTLSGDDSGLKNTWDEICVQIQYQESVCWYVYEETVKNLVEYYVSELPQHEAEAIWLQTEEGFDWLWEEPASREVYPLLDEDVVQYVIQDYIYLEAGRWSNARIRSYLDDR